MRDDSGLDQNGRNGSGKRGLHFEYIFEVKPTGFANGLIVCGLEKESE